MRMRIILSAAVIPLFKTEPPPDVNVTVPIESVPAPPFTCNLLPDASKENVGVVAVIPPDPDASPSDEVPNCDPTRTVLFPAPRPMLVVLSVGFELIFTVLEPQ